MAGWVPGGPGLGCARAHPDPPMGPPLAGIICITPYVSIYISFVFFTPTTEIWLFVECSAFCRVDTRQSPALGNDHVYREQDSRHRNTLGKEIFAGCQTLGEWRRSAKGRQRTSIANGRYLCQASSFGILAFCRLVHRTVRCTTGHCPVQISFLFWRNRPLTIWSRWRTGHCPVHTGQSGAPIRRLARPRVTCGLRGRPLAHRIVRCTTGQSGEL
jgi:hypothetical protein